MSPILRNRPFRPLALLMLLFAVAAPAVRAEEPVATLEPVYRDDREFVRSFANRLGKLAKAGKCVAPAELKAKLKPAKCRLTLPAAAEPLLTPEEIYRRSLQSTLAIGSVEYVNDNRPRWEDVSMGTAWVLTADGVVVTNCHMFQDVGEEFFGVCTHNGDVYPMTDLLACDLVEDLAIIKVDADGLTPLAIEQNEPVGAWVGVLSHPADAFYTFTQGSITRYHTLRERRELTYWMSITAEFAYGSSGGPVLNRKGNVVGIATMTTAVVYPDDDEVGPGDSALQMVVKAAVPTSRLMRLIEEKQR